MNDQRDGISSPAGTRKVQAAEGHSKTCWAGALGQARRGRPPEDFTVSAERAIQMLAADPAVCRCQPANKGVRGRRQRS